MSVNSLFFVLHFSGCLCCMLLLFRPGVTAAMDVLEQMAAHLGPTATTLTPVSVVLD